MRRVLAFLALIVALPSLAAAQSLEFPALRFTLENYLRAAAFDDDGSPTIAYRPPEQFTIAGGQTAFSGLLSAYPARFYGLERHELSPFGTALEGAGQGMTLGLLAGALGTTAGLFGEETAWYVAGGMAAVGALFGATYGASDPARRIRYRWTPPPEHDGADALHHPND